MISFSVVPYYPEGRKSLESHTFKGTLKEFLEDQAIDWKKRKH
jgi:hypothetical protein